MSGDRDKAPDPKGTAALYARPGETVGTHLAHWPPPRFEREAKPTMINKRAAGEDLHRARPRGWRLTRAMFSEFEDDED